MNVMDILKTYVDRPTDTHQDFDEIARLVPAETLGGGISEALRSDRTPDFGSMVSSLFGGSNPQQRAGLLGQLIRTIGPGVLSSIAGGAFAKFRQPDPGSPTPAEISPATAASVSTDQVREIAAAAQKEDPSVLDRVGAYYSQHPEVVKVLGGAALAIALGQIGNRLKR